LYQLPRVVWGGAEFRQHGRTHPTVKTTQQTFTDDTDRGGEDGTAPQPHPTYSQRLPLASLPRYHRRQTAVNQLIREVLLRGISTRQVNDVLQPVLGEAYSATNIFNITRQLNTAVQQFHRGPPVDEYLYLLFDGIVLKVRNSARKVRRRMILVAHEVTRAGQCRVLAYQFAQDESQAAWEQFLQDLYLRRLEGKALQLIVSDGGKGLQAPFRLSFSQRVGAALLGPQAPQHRRQSLPPGGLLCGGSLRQQ